MTDAGWLVHEPSGRRLGPGVVLTGLTQRLSGMLLRTAMGARTGRVFYAVPDFWVHSLGMKMSIDLAFCDREGRVLRVMTLPPNRFSPPVFRTKLIWESAVGSFDGICVGDVLRCG